MKTRQVFGIVFLLVCVLCSGPLFMLAGMVYEEQLLPLTFGALFATPGGVLLLLGVLLVGGPWRTMATGYTLLACVAYGALLSFSVGPMFNSPDFEEMLRLSMAQQGQAVPSQPLAIGFEQQRPLLLLLGMLTLGLAALAWHYLVRGNAPPAFKTRDFWLGVAQPGAPRPRSVQVLAWLLIAFGALGFLAQSYPGLPGHLENMRVAMRFYGVSFDDWRLSQGLWQVTMMLCGVFLLRGANWARWTLIVSMAISTLLAMIWFMPVGAGVEMGLLSGIFWAVVAVYFLFVRRPARLFFAAQAHRDENRLSA